MDYHSDTVHHFEEMSKYDQLQCMMGVQLCKMWCLEKACHIAYICLQAMSNELYGRMCLALVDGTFASTEQILTCSQVQVQEVM
jgi:hypothetical protein